MRTRGSWVIASALLLVAPGPTSGQVSETVTATLQHAQHDLAHDGRTFLIDEASKAAFFMLGELHGDNETPALIRMLWPDLWKLGYRHIAAELSPWAATNLEFPDQTDVNAIQRSFSWSRADVAFVAEHRTGTRAVLWGCDMEEPRPQALIRALAAANPANGALQSAVTLSQGGYRRADAPSLLQSVQTAGAIADPSIGGVSLRENITRTLEIEVHRMSPDTRLQASTRREALMKELFFGYWQSNGRPKVMLRFGANHLHRGIDSRGVSTLGNFVAELAAANREQVFNVVEFTGGGQILAGGRAVDYTGDLDDAALAFLASIARHSATVFDLRPIRQALHRIPEAKRSATESRLVYFADSYDAAIFYRSVTPARP
jgi:hypothetical protein